MPIRPRPFTFVCGKCGWKKTVAPPSDALGPGDWCDRCEKCGNEALTLQPANLIDRTLAEWFARLRR
ncbi:hypothetical protein PMI31_00806 [Pseudomonas sp. GM55]|nr:hypothetical protein PMI31_00806 [Pseudomonas sp. GM55]